MQDLCPLRSECLSGERYRFVEIDLADVVRIDEALSARFNEIAQSRPSSVACINNAAVAGPVGVAGRLNASDIAASLAVNLAAPAAVANLFCRKFVDRDQDRRIVNVSSAANAVVITRWSIQAEIVSTNGTIKKSPGPRKPMNLPRRSTTARSHCRAIAREAEEIVPTCYMA